MGQSVCSNTTAFSVQAPCRSGQCVACLRTIMRAHKARTPSKGTRLPDSHATALTKAAVMSVASRLEEFR